MAGTIDQLIKLSGAQQVKSELAAIGKEGEKAFGGIEKSATSASGGINKVGQAAGGAVPPINAAGKAADTLNSVLAGFVGGLAAGGITALANGLMGLVRGFLAAAEAAGKLQTAQNTAAQRAGQTTKNFTEVEAAFKRTGLSADTAGEFVKLFAKDTTEALKAARAAEAKKGVFFAPGPAGDAALVKQMTAAGGESAEAAKKMAPFLELMRMSGAKIDPMTGALQNTTEVTATLYDNLQKLAGPLERIQALQKMGFSEAAAREIAPRAALGGDPVRKAAAEEQRLQAKSAEQQAKLDAAAEKKRLADLNLAAAQEASLRTLNTMVLENQANARNEIAELLNLITRARQAPGPVAGDPTAGLAPVKQAAEETKEVIDGMGTSPPDFSPLVTAAQTAFDAIILAAQKTAAELKRLLPAGGGTPGLVVPSGPGEMASGGSVRGPGSGTSDSILARLSNGEYVVRAAAVRHYGSGLLAAINSMRFAGGGLVPGFAAGGQARSAQDELISRAMTAGFAAANALNQAMRDHQQKISEILNNLLQAFTGGAGGVQIGFGRGPVNQLADGGAVQGFSMGGLVNALAPMLPGLAGGGLVPAPSQSRSLHPVTISLPGGNNVSGLLAPPSAVDRLEREVLLKSPTGRAPSWRGR
jgi:hypothetical protein